MALFWDEVREVPQFPQAKGTGPVAAVFLVAPLPGAEFPIPGVFPVWFWDKTGETSAHVEQLGRDPAVGIPLE